MARTAGVDGRQRVLQAAATLFYARGIESVSVDDVAAEAGLTKRALYYHFPSKQALVHGYLEAADAPALALLRGLAAVPPGQRRHPFEQILLGLGKWLQSGRCHGCAFLRAARSLPADAAVQGLARSHKDATLAWLETVAAAAGAPDPLALAGQFRLIVDAVLSTGHLYDADALVATAQGLLGPLLDRQLPAPAQRRKPGATPST
jgi:AcrR family transcriptional regulator